MFYMRQFFGRALFALYLIASPATVPGAETRCTFDETKLEFAGSPLEQAKCLLRPVAEFGRLGEPLASLPAPLETLIGQPVTVEKAKLQSYLESHQIKETEIGGA